MSRYHDIDPQDIDPETNRPYAGYSSPSLDDSFHRHEMELDDPIDRLTDKERRRLSDVVGDDLDMLAQLAEIWLDRDPMTL